MANVFSKVGGLFGNAASTAENIGEALTQPDSSGNTPTSGGTTMVAFDTNLANKPFNATTGFFGIGTDIYLRNSAYIYSDNFALFAAKDANNNMSYSPSTTPSLVMDLNKKIFYGNLDLAKITLDVNGIHRSNLAVPYTAPIAVDQVNFQGSNLYCQNVTCVNISTPTPSTGQNLVVNNDCNLILNSSYYIILAFTSTIIMLQMLL